jgi:hypothetical protein
LARGVEPLGAAALLTPADGVGDGPEPAVAAPLLVFFVASSKAFFFVVASSTTFFFAAASSAAFFLAAASMAFFFSVASSATSFAAASSTASFVAAALVAAAVSPAAESYRWTPRAPLPVQLLTRQASAWSNWRGPPAVNLPRQLQQVRRQSQLSLPCKATA